MMLKPGDKVARISELGTVVGAIRVGDPPDEFEGDWPTDFPGHQGRRMAVIAWPGRKKLAIEPEESLITLGSE
jgi:hypothetical protein